MSKPVIVAAIIVIKSLIMLLMLFSSVVALAVSPAVLLPPARLADLGLYWCAVRKCRFHRPDYIGSSGPYYLHTSFFIDWNLCYGSVAPIDMNSLANLNAVVDEHGEPTSWPSEGWDPPVATICTAVLPDTRLHFHPSNATRQDWDWPDNPMILASQYSAEEQEIECKPNIMQVEALDGGSSTGLRQYNGILTAANIPAMATAQNLWPGVLNAAAIRQNMGLEINSSSSYSPSFYGGLGGGAGSSAWINGGYGQGGSTSVNNYLGIGEARTALEQRHGHLLGLPNINHRRIHDILKRGMYASGSGGTPDFSARIGLNLGGRTYFSTEDNSTLARFGKRFQPNPPTMHVPLCQAEGCKADLSMAKHYHRRHKVCEYHSKAATVMINGNNGNNTQRFCQQCSRFHALSEFDEGKRSCRKRLADHNRRRRKPQPSPATAAATPIASFNADSTMKLNDEASKEDKGGRSEEQAHEQHKEAAMAATSSEPTPSLLSPMSLAPSVMLTLQNGNREMQATATSEENEKEPAYESQPYLLNGPSLSLSNIAAAGAAGGGSTPSHQQGQSSPQNFGDVEMSVPWLRTHHLGSSTRMALMQESMGRSASLQAKKESMSNSTSHGNGQYMNEHGRLLAEHLQSLQSQVESSTDHYHHQMHGKTENWILESTNVQEGQTVLSLLETASTSKKDHQHHQNVFNAEAQENAGSRPPIGFLQQHVGHLNSPGDMNHETSDDAAISLHRMQVLRPLDESLHTTADFMKDGFV